jgi:uncharacterized membrane protein (UPF0127 family)
MTQTFSPSFAAFASAFALALVGCSALAQQPPPAARAPVAQPALPTKAQSLPTEPVSVVSGGKTHTFQAEIADDDGEREIGLMFRETMAKDHGMLFVYPAPAPTGVWMKNTKIPLDMLFIDTDGKVLAIAENARPGSLRVIDPGVQVKGFLEINGGLAKELGIKPGAIVKHRAFTPKANG